MKWGEKNKTYGEFGIPKRELKAVPDGHGPDRGVGNPEKGVERSIGLALQSIVQPQNPEKGVESNLEIGLSPPVLGIPKRELKGRSPALSPSFPVPWESRKGS